MLNDRMFRRVLVVVDSPAGAQPAVAAALALGGEDVCRITLLGVVPRFGHAAAFAAIPAEQLRLEAGRAMNEVCVAAARSVPPSMLVRHRLGSGRLDALVCSALDIDPHDLVVVGGDSSCLFGSRFARRVSRLKRRCPVPVTGVDARPHASPRVVRSLLPRSVAG